jgi:hypothetical protein
VIVLSIKCPHYFSGRLLKNRLTMIIAQPNC